MTICPIRSNRYSNQPVECCSEQCAWWLGDGCSVAYVGANCKTHVRPWRDHVKMDPFKVVFPKPTTE